MQNSMVVLTFYDVDGKHPFWAILVQKIKIVSLSWNLEPKFEYVEFNGGAQLFSFMPKNTLFGKQW